MAKAYWIARVDVKDPERYKDYVSTAKPAFEKYGAKFLARGGPFEVLEGQARARNVVIEFPSMEAAMQCCCHVIGVYCHRRLPSARSGGWIYRR